MKTFKIITRLILFLLLFNLHPICLAQDWEQIVKIVASDRSMGARFGWSVSISGNYAIVGATGDQFYKGAAYILTRSGSTWIQQQKLVADDGDNSELFGYSVCISEDYAIVGAIYDSHTAAHNDSLFRAGSAYIFKRDGNTWIQQQKLVCSNRRREDYFGMAVSISNDYAIIGAPLKEYYYTSLSDSITDTGAAYIFKRVNNSWIEQQKLVAFKPQSGAWFGNAVAISGNDAIVGAFDETINPNYTDSMNIGVVYTYRLKDTIWTNSHKLVAPDSHSSDNFGHSLSISENLLIISSPDHDYDTSSVVTPQAGAAYIYSRIDTTWYLQQKIFEPHRYRDHHFGFSVSISGDYALAGSNGSFAYMFKKTDNNWVLQKIINALDHSNTSGFGYAVSVFGEYSVIGAYSDFRDTSGGNSMDQAGSAYIFGLVSGTDIEPSEDFQRLTLFNLNQNYPNPFNPNTKISWQSPVASHQTLKVFDVLGNEIVTLVDEYKPAGRYEVEFQSAVINRQLASGIYFYQLKAGEYVSTKKMILLK